MRGDSVFGMEQRETPSAYSIIRVVVGDVKHLMIRSTMPGKTLQSHVLRATYVALEGLGSRDRLNHIVIDADFSESASEAIRSCGHHICVSSSHPRYLGRLVDEVFPLASRCGQNKFRGFFETKVIWDAIT